MDKDKILATVNGKEITGVDYNLFLDSLNPQIKQYFAGEDMNKEIINELIYQALLYEDAIAKGMDKDEEFLQVVEKTKESMLKNYALGKLLATVDVTEDEVKKFYEENKEAFKEKESANASHILVSEEDKAREIYEKVKDGEDFETLAKKNSTCPSKEKGGDLGTFTRGQMVKEFEDAVFENEVGTVTEPVKTQFGYHIIKINEKNEGRDLEFDEVKDKIFSQLKRQKEQDLYNKKIEELKEKYDVKMNV
ncbi:MULTISPECIES: peptidylprolyl isomerase [Peptoniphilus]|uniref:peptidylprolyl isomerase n=1 Tax=Peptoniphilus TaxID=162289 RepID=UPI0002888193|nr:MULTISPECIES: peptidylprolyl isomerase [Peptoniphilus]MDU1043840.1 peptidylprolyl isomerase [Peptoniphilus rhinitidis]MDU2110357.1 peptidylprolyl isomerase [Peptoniphilus lacydonensis]MDU3751024.1 peptidylprolyl isomerase [Peptoniphilus rhinitidis]MDU5377163.1 peptidylprolyl isomerase [Peptoniphilus lacydonensis]MDU5436888.1 peptidylprolyl isomerase [Peptoniphilus lacydonensis]